MAALPTKRELLSQQWRLNNLYWIVDKSGEPVLFKMNWAQEALFRDMHYLNVVLKARQLGFTTFIDLFLLDNALWNPNIHCGIIAHNIDDANVIFRNKIKFPYEHLPNSIRSNIPAKTDRVGEYVFSNGSSIRVSTSMRSGTLQFLHVSEYGKIAARYPDKADEIKTGAFQAVAPGQVIFVESTAEGAGGEFYELCQRAQKIQQAGKKLSPLDWKFHFYPWHRHPEYRVAGNYPIHDRVLRYFEDLEGKGIKLDTQQQQWYTLKEADLGDAVWREYPSSPEEAFKVAIDGAYFSSEMATARRDGRIAKVPHDKSAKVDTYWDLGMNDSTAIWFAQTVGREIHLVDYYENSGEGMLHYLDILRSKQDKLGYRYGTHYGPHDLGVREFASGESRVETARKHGFIFEVAPRPLRKADAIQAARNKLALCWFDEAKCSRGIDCLDNYRKEWDDRLGVWRTSPRHDEYSHGADAFQLLAQLHGLMLEKAGQRGAVKTQAKPSARAWT